MTADPAQPSASPPESSPETPVPAPSPTSAEAAAKSPREIELETELAQVKDKALRALAEAENTRRRVEADKIEAVRYAAADFAREIVTVADNLRRALASIGVEARAKDPALETLAVGVEMTERALLAAFERFGIKRIEALEKRFDPHLHEAMFEIEDKTKPSGTVVQELETGYVMHNRPLRPAKVAVSKGGPPPVPAQSPAGPVPTQAPGAAYGRPQGETGAKLDEQL
ncbi:MAG: nucleotide exchange factor GrpE [Rhodospirillales bacterium]|nr:nucleotide exchange factor GrpE [Rhodospirillales bacterium]